MTALKSELAAAKAEIAKLKTADQNMTLTYGRHKHLYTSPKGTLDTSNLMEFCTKNTNNQVAFEWTCSVK